MQEAGPTLLSGRVLFDLVGRLWACSGIVRSGGFRSEPGILQPSWRKVCHPVNAGELESFLALGEGRHVQQHPESESAFGLAGVSLFLVVVQRGLGVGGTYLKDRKKTSTIVRVLLYCQDMGLKWVLPL